MRRSNARFIVWTNMRKLFLSLLAAFMGLMASAFAADDVIISEFLAVNSTNLLDEDGDSSDWIELFNAGGAPVDMAGWSLTDNANTLRKWIFPQIDLEAGGYLVIFASGKDRRDPDQELHANFSLDGDGEYLALVGPDGEIAMAFSPAFPKQRIDVSYGLGEQIVNDYLVSGNSPATLHIPENGSLGLSWTEVAFDDADQAQWHPVEAHIGYSDGNAPDSPLPFGVWTFDGHASDESGHQHNGTINGARFDDDVPARIGAGNSILFDGTDDYVSIAIDVSETSFSSSFWFRTQQGGRGIFCVVDNDRGQGGHDRHVYLSGTNLGTRVWNEERITTSGKNYADNQWHHVAHVVGAEVGGQRLYVDGELVASGTKSFSDFDWQQKINIGFSNDGANDYFMGRIDEVSVWNDVLNEDEIAALSVGVPPPALSGFSPYIASDVGGLMKGINGSAYLRIPFSMALPLDADALSLWIRYDDGFSLYLNGVKIAERNAPDVLPYNALSLTDRPFTESIRKEMINLTAHKDLLREGTNILAFHGLNHAAGSDEFLLAPELAALRAVGERYFMNPSPGAHNDTSGISEFVADTTFSMDRGLYSEPIEVAISSATEDAIIMYTLDGSLPTLEHGTVYASPIYVDETTILKAAAFKENYGPTNIDTHTYIFPEDIVDDPVMLDDILNHAEYGPMIMPALYKIPTISLVTQSPINTSIEVATSVELIYPETGSGFQVNAGVKKVGGHSLNYPKNNMRLYFRSKYGAAKLDYPLFGGLRYGKGAARIFDQLNLHSGSHDTVFYLGDNRQSPSNAQYLRNRWIQDMQFEMDQLSLQGRFVHLYINGQYWGHYHVMERPTSYYVASHLGADKEDCEAVNSGRTVGSSSPAWPHITSITGDFDEFKRWVDINSYIDYMLLNFYAGNDWDWNPGQNWMAAGPSQPDQGGYRFFNWDADIILRRTNDHNLARGGPGNMLPALQQHEEFRRLLADGIHRHYFNQGILTRERAWDVYNQRAEEIVETLVTETARWRWNGIVWTLENQWRNEYDRLQNDFFQNRTAIVLDQLINAGLYPGLPAPEFLINGTRQHGGPIAGGDTFSVVVPTSTSFTDVSIAGSENEVKVYVPTDDALGKSWLLPGYVEGVHGESWLTGSGGVGYENGNGYQAAIGVDVGQAMTSDPGNTSVYVRIPFVIEDRQAIDDIENLNLKVLFDDGFAAYLNGTRVASLNAPIETQIAWNSGAVASHEASLPSPEVFALDAFVDLLEVGTNVLCVHGLNLTQTSSDMLVHVDLVERKTNTGHLSEPVYFTVDATDPMDGGSAEYTAPFRLNESVTIKARTFDGAAWSALTEATFVIPDPLSNLYITEIMYNPPSRDLVDGDQFEFVELKNTGPGILDLSGLSFTDGIWFDFPEGSRLLPDECLVLTSNMQAFQEKYPGVTAIAGVYMGNLSNAGDRLVLRDAHDRVILDVEYFDMPPWPFEADGGGYSMVPAGRPENGDPNIFNYWRKSTYIDGSPGEDDPVPEPGETWRLPGDFNQDEALDLSDAISIVLYLFSTSEVTLPCSGDTSPSPSDITLLDLNGDLGLDLSDAVYLLTYLFSHGQPPVQGTQPILIQGCH